MVSKSLSATSDSSHHTRVSVHESIAAGCEPACHGCRHRHLTSAASLAQKQGYLARTLAPWADRLQPVRSVADERRYGYRDRVTLNARWTAESGWRFGLMRRDELIAIHDCPVQTPRVNRLVQCLRGHAPPADAFPLAYLHVAGGQATLIVKSRRVEPDRLDDLIEHVAATGIEGLWLHLHPCAGRKLFARSGWQLLWGVPQSLGPGGVVHGPTAFQQLLPELHAASLELAAAHLAPRPGVAVLDLYCGLGTSLRHWEGLGATALGVELSGGAVECVARNAPRAQVLRGTCAQRMPQIRAWWRQQPSAGRHVAYLNPPRSGLEADVLEGLARELHPERIAYLSCSAGTLARDLVAFERAGYRVCALAPFDFFPGTHHVECLALLEATPRADAARSTLR
jgi:23S rRNA (uracil1939-C5)-methyltransferase